MTLADAWATDLLLVLDNCEHLVGACAELADRLLGACPQLPHPGHQPRAARHRRRDAVPVPPLSLPRRRRRRRARRCAEYDAVRLFVERAAPVRPGFGSPTDNAAAVAQICRRLDGIPLAIELAAARLRSLSAGAARRPPGRPLPAADRRQPRRRCRASRRCGPRVDWSYDLLDEPERALFAGWRCSPAGATLAAAEQVCAACRRTASPDGCSTCSPARWTSRC